MKTFTKIGHVVLAAVLFLFVNNASAQCPSGQVQVTIDVTTDFWGYEGYWELVPNGNACGSGTIFAGGNFAVGCNGGCLVNQPAGGYPSNSTISEGPWCLTWGADYDIVYVDDFGDGGFTFDVYVDGNLSYTFIGSGCGNTFTFNASQNWCSSGAISTIDTEIERVVFNDIDNSSSNCTGYSDFTAISTVAAQGSTYQMRVSTGDCDGGGIYNRGVAAYIDWNKDYDFNDPNEQVLLQPNGSPTTTTVNVTVPLGATLGMTRLRVVCIEGSNNPPPCGTFTWGETEDYSVMIVPPPCMNIQAGSDTVICNGEPVALGDNPTASNGVPPYTYSWAPATGLSSTTDPNPTATPSVTTTYTLTVTDSIGCTEVDSIEIVVNPVPVADAGPDVASCIFGSVQIGGNPTGSGGTPFFPENAYGAEAINGLWWKHSLVDATNPTVIDPGFTGAYFCGDFAADGYFYAIDNNNNNFTRVDKATGTRTVLGTSIKAAGHTWTGMAWDPTSNTMYASSTNGGTGTLYTINMNDGTATQYATMGISLPIWIAIDNTGQMYSLDIGTDNMYTVNKANGQTTLIGSAGFNANFAQDADFDPDNNVLYLSAFNLTTFQGELRVADVSTGNTTLITPFSTGFYEVAAFGIGAISPSDFYNFAWAPAGSLDDSTAANPMASPTTTTTYTVYVSDANGCVGTDEVTVTIYPLPDVTVTTTSPYCLNEGYVTLIPATPGGMFTGPGITNVFLGTFNPAVAGVGTHTLSYEVTDSNGCYNIGYFTIVVNDIPTADAGADQTICEGSSVIIGGSPTGTIGTSSPVIVQYSWSPSTGLNSSTDPNPTASPTVTTTYTVTVTDGNGCEDTDEITVYVNPAPVADAGADQTTCDNVPVTIGNFPTASAGTPPYTYSWSPATGLSSSSAPNPSANPQVTTTYTVTVTDANGCTDDDMVTVYVNFAPTVDAGSGLTTCSGSTVSLGGIPTASGGKPPYSYSWMPTTGLNAATIANPTATVTQTTTYTLTVTDANGCVGTDVVTVTIYPLTIADAGIDTAICSGEPVTLGGLVSGYGGYPPYTYVWGPSVGISTPYIPNPVATPTSTTIYTLTVTDANGCSATDEITIKVNPLPIADAGADQTICVGEVVMVGGSPTANAGVAPYTYEWSPSNGLSSHLVSNPLAGPNSTKNFTVTVVDVNGCTAWDVVTVFVRDQPSANAGLDKAICAGEGIVIGGSPAGSGGTPPYSYVWSPAASLDLNTLANPTASPSVTTQYTLTVYDGYGCKDVDSVTVVVNPIPVVGIDSLKYHYCVDDPIHMIYGVPPGGVFEGAGISGSTFNPAEAGVGNHEITYTYTDGNGCSNSITQPTTVHALPEVYAGPDKTVYLGHSTTLDAEAPAGYIYSWLPTTYLDDPSALTPNVITPLAQTTYSLTVTDPVYGCVNWDDVTVFVDINTPLDPPNTFTPNDDGKNDTWIIPMIEFFEDNRVEIYNRWGMMVYEKDGYTNGDAWTGDDLPEGTYFYIIKLNIQGETVHRGWVTIIR